MGKTKPKIPDWWETEKHLRDSGGLLIDVGLQGDGAVYGLDWSAEDRLAGVPPTTPRPTDVFIGHERDSDFEKVHSPLWPKVVEMLTGMTVEQLKPFAPIRIISPQQERIVWEWWPDEYASTVVSGLATSPTRKRGKGGRASLACASGL
jgi:hypothetical protein